MENLNKLLHYCHENIGKYFLKNQIQTLFDDECNFAFDIEACPTSETKEEMFNCHQYLHSNFVRALLYIGHGTMQVTASVFQFVPLQDFTSSSDIDWSKSIADIDNQLYRKYNLTEDEIAYIEQLIKPMD